MFDRTHDRDRDRDNNSNTAIVPNSILFNRRSSGRRKFTCPLSVKDAPVIDYKNLTLLIQYVSERGRILPSRITGISVKKQRALKRAIKIARNLALLPFATMSN